MKETEEKGPSGGVRFLDNETNDVKAIEDLLSRVDGAVGPFVCLLFAAIPICSRL